MELTDFEAWMQENLPMIALHKLAPDADQMAFPLENNGQAVATLTEDLDLSDENFADAFESMPAPPDGSKMHMIYKPGEGSIIHFGVIAFPEHTPKTPAKGGGLVKLLDPKAADQLYKGGSMTAPDGGKIMPAAPIMGASKPPSMEAELNVTQTFDFPYKGTVYQAKVTASPSKGFSCDVIKDAYGKQLPSGSGLDKTILGAVIVQYAIAQGFDPSFKGIMAPTKADDDGPEPDAEEAE